MRQLVLLLGLLGLVGGCDATDDIRPIDDVMIVELTDVGQLRIATESYDYCGIPVYVDSRPRPGVLDVEVIGARVVSASCDALIPGVAVFPLPELPIDIRIRHRGETDRYRVDSDRQLEAVRVSTTRPGPR